MKDLKLDYVDIAYVKQLLRLSDDLFFIAKESLNKLQRDIDNVEFNMQYLNITFKYKGLENKIQYPSKFLYVVQDINDCLDKTEKILDDMIGEIKLLKYELEG